MKRLFYLTAICGLMSLVSCNSHLNKVDPQKETEAVKLVLEKYRIANETQNLALIEEIWYPSEEIVSFGTEKGEKLIGISKIKEAVNTQFQAFKNTYISMHDQMITVSEDGRNAWFSMIINYNFILNNEALTYEGLCYTGVLVKKDDKWKLVLTHMSVPIKPIQKKL